MKTLYTNAVIYTGGRFAAGEFAVEGGRIVPVAGAAPDRTVDLGGRHVIPGLVDVHVHLREPGFSQKETIASGTAAAARGGYTTVCSMPNLNPAPDAPDTLRAQAEIIRRDAVVRVVPYGCITMGQRGAGELVDFAALAPDVVGFSDDGRGVQSDELMEEAMRRAAKAGRPVVAHCEVDDLLRGGYIHDGEYCRAHGHKGICSESEWKQVERDIALAEKTGCQYHVCHVSTKESVELVRRAKARGVRVSCETAPHYLLLCDEDLQEDGRFKMNPPLRSREDRAALIAGVADGTIEVIATDHAPHTMEEKELGFLDAPNGIIGLECAYGVCHKILVDGGFISDERLIELMSTGPAELMGHDKTDITAVLDDYADAVPGDDDTKRVLDLGRVPENDQVDLVVLNTGEEWTVDPEKFHSSARNTPFGGWQVTGRPLATIIGSKLAFSRIDKED